MNMPTKLREAAVAASLTLISAMTSAQTTTTGSPSATNDAQTTQSTYSSPALAATPTDKLVARFSAFAGSDENAASLVNGLRTGSEITLTDSGSNGSTGGSTTFVSPTRPMGYGNIRIALSLAQARLNSEGYPQPTAEQLQTALLGDTSGAATQTTSQTQGILQMRADGMGWGQIANSMGFKLGPVMSGRVPASSAGTGSQTGTDTSTTANAAGAPAGGSGITTAGGRPMGKHGAYDSHASQGKGNGASASGIVTANGTAAGGGAGRNSRAFTAAGNANGHAVTAGSSGATSSSGAVSANGAGNGRGNAYGHSK